MNFQSLIDSPTHNKSEFGSDKNSEYSGSPYNNSYPSPPPSGGSDDEFQEEIKYALPYLSSPKSKNQASSSSSFTVSNAKKIHWFSNYAPSWKQDTSPKYHAPTLKPTFPNLFRNLNDNKGEPDITSKKKLVLHPSPKKGQVINCYTCKKRIRSSESEQHLFFGPVKCIDCERLVRECSDYSSCKISQYGRDRNCPHNVWEWIEKPVEYLKSELGSDEKSFKKALTKYVHSLDSLKSDRPYKKAIESCNEYLRFSCVKERRQSEAKVSRPEKPKTSKSEPRTKKRKSELFDNIQLPIDGHYLIEKKPIEECPNCYTELNPQDVLFNLDTWLISTKCKECHLSIYFVLDPPDGSDPRLQITLG